VRLVECDGCGKQTPLRWEKGFDVDIAPLPAGWQQYQGAVLEKLDLCPACRSLLYSILNDRDLPTAAERTGHS